MKTMTRSVLGSVAIVLLTTVMAVSRADAHDPQSIVKSTTDGVLQALRQGGTDKQHVYSLVEQMVLPHFDFRKMSQWVLGKNWRQGSPEEQQRFVSEFQKLLVRTYSTALMEYSGETVTYLPTQADDAGKIAVVKTQVVRSGGPTIPIDYRLYAADGDWKVFDVAVDGVSLVASYRTSFNEQIGARGFGGLVDELAARNAGKR
ncbi:MAG: ABC transporter substrate-binding protein [Gammaproteobacteria bacterium]|nr:ABC transporter substrate-binding protein [Gammaproteobacteria bacterium]MCG3144922.1 putative phospholipid-binding protein MlaC [Gammaproteobacteria bacterium]